MLGAIFRRMFCNEMKEFKIGLEREALRVNSKGAFVTAPHPKSLGSKLTHPHFTTDFAENQIEFVTKPYPSIKAALNALSKLHRYFYQTQKNELLWPMSMPPKLPHNIPIADFGTSHKGRDKHIYRIGLTKRYPIEMQLISGIHANYSFSPALFKKLKIDQTEGYMKVVRNFLRHGHLLSYLFGASPTPEYPFSTSMRLSPRGYYSRVQQQMNISFSSFSAYEHDLKKACECKHPAYEKIAPSDQLNANLLQIPGEHYTRIRPKSKTPGVIDYVEVRALDLNPNSPLGVNQEELEFTHLFLLMCLTEKDAPLSKKEQKELCENQNRIALMGRKPDLLPKSALTLLKKMRPLAKYLGLSENLERQIDKVKHPLPLTFDHPLTLAKKHKRTLSKKPLTETQIKKFETSAQNSLKEQTAAEARDAITTRGYEDLELSTQALILQAQKQGIEIEVLDRPHNIIRLSKGKHSEIIQQATRTSKDNYISPLLMDNKAVTKQLLIESNLNVAEGDIFHNIDAARSAYDQLQTKKLVIKPNTANFGLGIAFIKPKSRKNYESALMHAFAHAPSVIVEHFYTGDEVRFLVIDHKVVAVTKRIPANVIGDGKHTISELILQKNFNPNALKLPKEHIRLTHIEKAHLKSQRLTPKSIPGKGRTIFLRENSNLSTGGDPIDITDSIDAQFKQIAIKATKALNAKICGVDMLISKNTYRIIELNYNPQLTMHIYPYQGKPRPVCQKLLKFLGFT